MSVKDSMLKIVTCVQCKEIPVKPTLFCCDVGHSTCENCFLQNTLSRNTLNLCLQCKNRIVTRNVFAEEILKYYMQVPSNDDGNNSINYRSKMSAKRSHSQSNSAHSSKHDAKSCTSLRQNLSFMSISKRPVICPTTECNKMIAVTHLVSHFQFDHSKIPQEYMEMDQLKCLDLSLNNMEYSKTHCIALLLLSHSDSESCTSSQYLHDTPLAFPLLAAKISCKPTNAEETAVSDIVIVWICGNVDQHVKCTIEVSDDCRNRVYSYHGPINSLRESNDPDSVFARADCLLIHSSNINKITENGIYSMEMRALFSCPLDAEIGPN